MTEPSDTPTRKILCIDDDVTMLDLIKLIMKTKGFEILGADNGFAGMDLIASAKPDLVLLDIMMPEIDGIEVLERLKADPNLCHVPIVMCSARAEFGVIIQCLLMGAEDYITLPFTPSHMVDVVMRVLKLSGAGAMHSPASPQWLMDAYSDLGRHELWNPLQAAKLFCVSQQVADSRLMLQGHEISVREAFQDIDALGIRSKKRINMILLYMSSKFVELNPGSPWADRIREFFKEDWSELDELRVYSPEALMDTVLLSLREIAVRIQDSFLAVEADPDVRTLPIVVSEEDQQAGRKPYGSGWVVKDYAEWALRQIATHLACIDNLLSRVEERKTQPSSLVDTNT